MNTKELDYMLHRVQGPYEGNTKAMPSLCIPAMYTVDGSSGVAASLHG